MQSNSSSPSDDKSAERSSSPPNKKHSSTHAIGFKLQRNDKRYKPRNLRVQMKVQPTKNKTNKITPTEKNLIEKVDSSDPINRTQNQSIEYDPVRKFGKKKYNLYSSKIILNNKASRENFTSNIRISEMSLYEEPNSLEINKVRSTMRHKKFMEINGNFKTKKILELSNHTKERNGGMKELP